MAFTLEPIGSLATPEVIEAAVLSTAANAATAEAAVALIEPGVPGGIATLDGDGAIPESQVPARLSIGSVEPAGLSTATLASLSNTIGVATGEAIAEAVENGTIPATAPRTYLDGPFAPESDVFPLYPTATQISGWGSSSIDGLRTFLETMAAGVGATYYNGGKPGEISLQSSARLGSRPALVTVTGGSIPASGAVAVTVSNLPQGFGGNLLPFIGTLNGVEGTLSQTSTTSTFTRTATGAVTAVLPDTPFLPKIGQEHRADVLILAMGKNDLDKSRPGYEIGAVDAVNSSFDWAAPLYKRVLVLGLFADTALPVDDLERGQIAYVEAAWKKRYGLAFLSLADFLASPDVWTYTGITPTTADTAAQATRNLPPSLTADGQHLNTFGRTAVTRLIKERLMALKWYSETGPVEPGGPTAPVITIITSDSFAGVDGTEVVGRTTDAALGGTPMVYQGVNGGTIISGNKLARGAGGLTWCDVLPMSVADYETTALVTTMPTGSGYWIDARRVSVSGTPNTYRVSLGSTGALALSVRIANETTLHGSTSYAVGDRVGIRVKGSAISMLKNGVVVATFTDAAITGAGFTGPAGGAATTALGLDDLIVQTA
jgi:hypothetical protein